MRRSNANYASPTASYRPRLSPTAGFRINNSNNYPSNTGKSAYTPGPSTTFTNTSKQTNPANSWDTTSTTPAISTVTSPTGKYPIYFAADLPPTENIPIEAPLCYKFMVEGPEEQLNKLKKKYPSLYGYTIYTNNDGSKTLVAKRSGANGEEISYYYSTSAARCNEYQESRFTRNTYTITTSQSPQEEKLGSSADEPERIKFGGGETMNVWSGTIWGGEKRFKLWMKKGQQLRLGGDHVYTWHVLTIKGEKLGCLGGDYCSSVSAINTLPYSGDYTIVTFYRMSSCYSHLM